MNKKTERIKDNLNIIAIEMRGVFDKSVLALKTSIEIVGLASMLIVRKRR